MQGPAHPAVLDLVGQRTLAPMAQLPAAAIPAASVEGPSRQVNQNYVRIKLYDSEKTAAQARDLLSQHDIPCTVEHGISGVAPQLFALVGLTPFEDSTTPEYTAYVQKIKSFLGATKTLRLIKWGPAPQESVAKSN
jgi:hypothetical protein